MATWLNAPAEHGVHRKAGVGAGEAKIEQEKGGDHVDPEHHRHIPVHENHMQQIGADRGETGAEADHLAEQAYEEQGVQGVNRAEAPAVGNQARMITEKLQVLGVRIGEDAGGGIEKLHVECAREISHQHHQAEKHAEGREGHEGAVVTGVEPELIPAAGNSFCVADCPIHHGCSGQ
jgi:hypothetical protein